MVAVRKAGVDRTPRVTGQAPRGSVEPGLLLVRALDTIDRMAEAMWQDEAIRATGQRQRVKWEDAHTEVREKWTRSATAGFLTLLEPCPE